eukprot:CAMPEP_0176027614 /NCGR_PEP_ID=MMETSP0120_2-20121206/13543_1 /TAXON_ID=160619 /ORGANISM="Kryptoperidinium foliaceum, Strain CCMP 1326" /LENGTH=174 /DNA_ID=CAMNT_0017360819 /DNA_START=86 /DNA_END=610 /DNA_ORIENTATION=+
MNPMAVQFGRSLNRDFGVLVAASAQLIPRGAAILHLDVERVIPEGMYHRDQHEGHFAPACASAREMGGTTREVRKTSIAEFPFIARTGGLADPVEPVLRGQEEQHLWPPQEVRVTEEEAKAPESQQPASGPNLPEVRDPSAHELRGRGRDFHAGAEVRSPATRFVQREDAQPRV